MKIKKSLCVFCGSSNDVDARYLQHGAALGTLLAKRGVGLVYGGGDCGVMGALAGAVMKAGGHVTGVFPITLRNLEREHGAISEIILVDTMHERKQGMFERADAFAVLPGGFGTLDEMFEILTWRQLLLHNKPVVIFNDGGYWDPLVALMNNIIGQRFAKAEVGGFFRVVDRLEDILPGAGL